jgi:dTDP-4-dehydrorhamnose 3,5-epimerase-like enzyme
VREFGSGLPFIPKRSFITFDVPVQKVRGGHAHLRCHQLLVCLRGSVCCHVDNGLHSEEILLNSPEVGLYIEPMVWAKQYSYSADAMLQVFASEPYDSQDFISDYKRFLSLRTARSNRKKS